MNITMNLKSFLASAVAAVGITAMAGSSVSVDKVQQRYPWNGLVDIDYTVDATGLLDAVDLSVTVTVDGVAHAAKTFTWLDPATSASRALTLTSGNDLTAAHAALLGSGKHRLTWNAPADNVKVFSKNCKVMMSFTRGKGNYMVVNLNTGAVTMESNQLPTKYMDDKYKTTHMAFLRIAAAGKTFMMGQAESEINYQEEASQHQVSFTKDFYLALYPTTQKQYQLIMNAMPSYFTADWESRPVEQVSWDEAVAFCNALKTKAGNRLFQLPTEAQWEYACRAGTTTSFYNGTTITNAETDANAMLIGACAANRDWRWTGSWNDYKADSTTVTRPEAIGGTRKVGSYAMNGFGLFDMNGNVWQWCSDWQAAFTTAAVIDPTGPGSGTSRVRRGGAWCRPASQLCSGHRDGYTPTVRSPVIGFRVSCAVQD